MSPGLSRGCQDLLFFRLLHCIYMPILLFIESISSIYLPSSAFVCVQLRLLYELSVISLGCGRMKPVFRFANHVKSPNEFLMDNVRRDYLQLGDIPDLLHY
jgi:hypothetical protein